MYAQELGRQEAERKRRSEASTQTTPTTTPATKYFRKRQKNQAERVRIMDEERDKAEALGKRLMNVVVLRVSERKR